jgi:hypothetical protein
MLILRQSLHLSAAGLFPPRHAPAALLVLRVPAGHTPATRYLPASLTNVCSPTINRYPDLDQ